MNLRVGLAALAVALGLPAMAAAAEAGAALDPPAWAGLPFLGLLVAIAVLPLAAGRFWHRNRNKALVAAAFALPVAGYLLSASPRAGAVLARPGAQALLHVLAEYASFIILLATLYTVAGGVVLRGGLRARPGTNTAVLALGAVLANFIGTTGASMLLIRPFLQANRQRRHGRHLPVFFIFVVSNLGGMLTPLGDPPLFLGFLHGVDFFWTLSLWPHWLVANGAVLLIFFAWDALAYRREGPAGRTDMVPAEPARLDGLVNVLILAGVVAVALLHSPRAADGLRGLLGRVFPCPDLTLRWPWGELALAGLALLSLLVTPRRLRQANGFGWGPIAEVAILFAGIFVAMAPALAWLARHGAEFGLAKPWQFFWLTGGLSSFLDNAPTYLTFATVAAGPHDLAALAHARPLLLQAISVGAVCMGANTYIGNGPNFMVQAIAEDADVPTPSFVGYMGYAAVVLLPVFLLMTWLFFRPA